MSVCDFAKTAVPCACALNDSGQQTSAPPYSSANWAADFHFAKIQGGVGQALRCQIFDAERAMAEP
jgi:hypothetical protein